MKRLFFDTETTELIVNSLLPLEKQPRIIEISAILVDARFEILDEIESYVDPGIPLSEEVQKITGIKPEDLAGAPVFERIANSIMKLVHDADEIVAHNLNYDTAVIEAEFARLGRAIIWPEIRTCTVEATEWVKGHRLNLSTLHEICTGQTLVGAHRARVDVKAMIECYRHGLKEGWFWNPDDEYEEDDPSC